MTCAEVLKSLVIVNLKNWALMPVIGLATPELSASSDSFDTIRCVREGQAPNVPTLV